MKKRELLTNLNEMLSLVETKVLLDEAITPKTDTKDLPLFWFVMSSSTDKIILCDAFRIDMD